MNKDEKIIFYSIATLLIVYGGYNLVMMYLPFDRNRAIKYLSYHVGSPDKLNSYGDDYLISWATAYRKGENTFTFENLTYLTKTGTVYIHQSVS